MLPIDAHDRFIAQGGMIQIMIAIIGFEAISCFALKETMDGNREPGYFGFDPLGLGKDVSTFNRYQLVCRPLSSLFFHLSPVGFCTD